jgi:hypothetical protein
MVGRWVKEILRIAANNARAGGKENKFLIQALALNAKTQGCEGAKFFESPSGLAYL